MPSTGDDVCCSRCSRQSWVYNHTVLVLMKRRSFRRQFSSLVSFLLSFGKSTENNKAKNRQTERWTNIKLQQVA